MKKYIFSSSLAVLSTLFFGCMSNGTDTIVFPEKSSSSSEQSSSSAEVSSSSSTPSSSSSEPSSSSSIESFCENASDISDYKIVKIGNQTWTAENLKFYVPDGSKCYGDGETKGYNSDGTTSTIAVSPAEIQANCDKYGRAYDWAAAMCLPSKCNTTLSTSDEDCAVRTPYHQGVCPPGWHIPNAEDWGTLMQYVDPSCSISDYSSDQFSCDKAGTELKAKSDWLLYPYAEIPLGNDTHGFAALPGGHSTAWVPSGDFADWRNVGRESHWWSAKEVGAERASYCGASYENEDFVCTASRSKRGHWSYIRCVKDN